jgi:glycosyltransferase involved in cell wall biosynthesis
MHFCNKPILFVLPSLTIGGAEINTVKLANYLVAQGYEVHILILLQDIRAAYLLDTRVSLTSLGSSRYIFALPRLITTLRRIDPSYVLANLWPITLIVFIAHLARPLGFSRLILVEHIDISKGLQSASLQERILEYCFHIIAPLVVAKLIGVSPGVVSSLRKLNIHAYKYKYIPNPIFSRQQFTGYPSRSPMPIAAPQITALAVGSFKPQKDYKLMIDSIYSLYKRGIPIYLTIAGDGPLLAEIKEYARGLMPPDRVTFLGFVSLFEVQCLYKSSDVYLLTSAWEGFCNSLAEALVSGCRCVAIDCPSGPSEVLCSGTLGTLVPNRDPNAFGNAILNELSLDRNLSERTNHINSFAVESVARQYLDAMTHLV